MYKIEDIPAEFYLNKNDTETNRDSQTSYWKKTESEFGIGSEPSPSIYRRIDYYWSKVGNLTDDQGRKKFPQLFAVLKCVLSLSHGNSSSESGFSLNKALLEVHGSATHEDTIMALRLVKDSLIRHGGITNIPISHALIQSVKHSYGRYEADLEASVNWRWLVRKGRLR